MTYLFNNHIFRPDEGFKHEVIGVRKSAIIATQKEFWVSLLLIATYDSYCYTNCSIGVNKNVYNGTYGALTNFTKTSLPTYWKWSPIYQLWKQIILHSILHVIKL